MSYIVVSANKALIGITPMTIAITTSCAWYVSCLSNRKPLISVFDRDCARFKDPGKNAAYKVGPNLQISTETNGSVK